MAYSGAGNRAGLVVVSPSEALRRRAARALLETGCRVRSTRHLLNLERWAGRGRVHLAVIDAACGPRARHVCLALGQQHGVRSIVIDVQPVEAARVEALELGADRVMEAPLRPRELAALARALLRRRGVVPAPEAPSLGGGDEASPELSAPQRSPEAAWRLSEGRFRLTSPTGLGVTLTVSEYRLLRAFAERPGSWFGRASLCGVSSLPPDRERAVDVILSRIRRKIRLQGGDPAGLIRTGYGRGYSTRAPILLT